MRIRTFVAARALAACALLAACGVRGVLADPEGPPVPAKAAAARGLAAWLNPATAPFIPIPAIAVDPYSGVTLGVIPTVLRTNARQQIEQILAPDVIHSEYFGWGSRMRIFDYPSEDTQWMVVGGGKERVEREFDGRYAAGQTRRGPLSGSLEAIYDRSGTPHFFGIGNESLYSNQTSYLDDQARLDAQVGYNFSPRLQLGYLVRVRYVDVLPGVLPKLPSIQTLFPGTKGLGANHELQQRLILTYDTRDSLIIPTSGSRYLLYGGFVSRALGSSVSYTFFGAEARHYWRLSSRLTFAWHAELRYMPSAGSAPFWALSSLGGDRSVPGEVEPLRSEGPDRYLDRNLSATGAELRMRVAGFDAFGTYVALELTPFVDIGKVFSAPGTSPLSDLHHALGIGFRGLASPYVVGYVDFAYGDGRGAVFSGIDYPF